MQLRGSSFLVSSSFYITKPLTSSVCGWLHPEYTNRPNLVSFELGEYPHSSHIHRHSVAPNSQQLTKAQVDAELERIAQGDARPMSGE
jgi:hypothetical protein